MGVASKYLYCDQADIERRLSAEGLSLRLDHNRDSVVDAGELASMTDAISDASETIQYYTFFKYDPGVLRRSAWVNHRTVDLAVYLICGVRVNPVPDSVFKRAQDAEKYLEEIRTSKGAIPGCPVRRRMAPTWSNVILRPGFQYKVIRVEPNTSAPPAPGVPRNVDFPANFTFEL